MTPLVLAAGVVLVSLSGESAVAVLDEKALPQVATVGVGCGPHEITLSPDGRLAPTLARMEFSKRPGGRVRQVWQPSVDEGRTWRTDFDGVHALDEPDRARRHQSISISESVRR